MRYLTVDEESGHILRMGSHAGPETIEAPDGVRDGSHWWDGAWRPREAVAIIADKDVIRADGQDMVTVSGLPDPCWLRVGKKKQQAAGGVLTLTAEKAGVLRVHLIGRYRAPVLKVVAVEAEDYDATPLRRMTAGQKRQFIDQRLSGLPEDLRRLLKAMAR